MDESEAGEVLIELRDGIAVWSSEPFGAERRTLQGVQAQLIPLAVLRAGKANPRAEAEQGAVDRADFAALSRLPRQQP